jgi:hypothetical protein
MNRKNLSRSYNTKIPQKIIVPAGFVPTDPKTSFGVLSLFHLQNIYMAGTLTAPRVNTPEVTFVSGAQAAPFFEGGVEVQ